MPQETVNNGTQNSPRTSLQWNLEFSRKRSTAEPGVLQETDHYGIQNTPGKVLLWHPKFFRKRTTIASELSRERSSRVHRKRSAMKGGTPQEAASVSHGIATAADAGGVTIHHAVWPAHRPLGHALLPRGPSLPQRKGWEETKDEQRRRLTEWGGVGMGV